MKEGRLPAPGPMTQRDRSQVGFCLPRVYCPWPLGYSPLTFLSSFFNIYLAAQAGFCLPRAYSPWPLGYSSLAFLPSFFLVFGCTRSYLQHTGSLVANSWLRHVGSGSLTRDWTWSPALGTQNLNHWTTKEVPMVSFRWGPQMRIKGSFFLDHNVKLSLALSTNVRQRATVQTFSLSWMTNKCAWSETAAVSVY